MKDKMIEEMYNLFLNYKYGKVDWKKFDCIDKDLFEFFYNAGYRKIPENAVVLTKEEYEALKTIESYHIKSCGKNSVVLTETERITMCVEQWDKGYAQARKETAREILNKVYSKITEPSTWKQMRGWWLYNGECEQLKALLNEIATCEGVEIKEN